jgi:hypothetical protein
LSAGGHAAARSADDATPVTAFPQALHRVGARHRTDVRTPVGALDDELVGAAIPRSGKARPSD